MENTELIVKIPEETYKVLKNAGRDWLSANQILNILNAVANGTPLPKGHGALIDVDKLIGKIHGVRFITAVLDAPTIIEADKER